MVKKIGWFSIILLLGFAVYAMDKTEMKKYTIPEGNHRSGLRYKPFRNKTRLDMTFRFDSTAIYQLGDNDHFDLNKLGGLAFGRNHHINSARICWRYNVEKEVIELFGYLYDHNKRVFSHITDYKIGVECKASIVINKETVTFTVGSVTKDYAKSKWPSWGYRLFPYFGGNKVAPHDVNIWLKMTTR